MFDRKTLLIATNNPGKVGEFRSLLANLAGIRLVTPTELGLHLEPAETGRTYAENASLKALAFAKAADLPALADDSGLEVAALSGAPGLRSARYAPQPGATDADRRAYLLAQLAPAPRPWPAVFRCVLCLALPDGQSFLAAGQCSGEIIPEERGTGGFGYDRIFQVAGWGRTLAELSPAEKDLVSHRAGAVLAAQEALKAVFEEQL